MYYSYSYYTILFYIYIKAVYIYRLALAIDSEGEKGLVSSRGLRHELRQGKISCLSFRAIMTLLTQV